MERGYLSVCYSDFASSQTLHIELDEGVSGATILGNRLPGGARIIDRTLFPVHIDHTPLNASPLPAYDFKNRPRPAGLRSPTCSL